MPLRLPVIAASTLDGVLEATDTDTPGDDYGHQQPQQEPTGQKGRPDGPIQDAMRGLQRGALRCVSSPAELQ